MGQNKMSFGAYGGMLELLREVRRKKRKSLSTDNPPSAVVALCGGDNKMKCEDCIYWQDGYCELRKIETCDGASCEKGELI